MRVDGKRVDIPTLLERPLQLQSLSVSSSADSRLARRDIVFFLQASQVVSTKLHSKWSDNIISSIPTFQVPGTTKVTPSSKGSVCKTEW